MEYRPRAPRDGVNVTPTHPAREALTLVVGVVALVVALVSAAFLVVELGVRFVPASLEVRVFGGLFAVPLLGRVIV